MTPLSLPIQRFAPIASALLVVTALAGCASRTSQAPVEDRPVAGRTAPPITTASASQPAAAPAAVAAPAQAEAAARPGTYVVKPGDTLIRIGLDNGQPWRDIARWNNIDNPNRIEVGQVLQVAPPGVDPAAAVTRPVLPPGRVAAPATGAASGAAAGAPVATSTSTSPAVVPASPNATMGGDEDIGWIWPAAGAVVSAFEEGKTKGLAIAGKAGDPVVAAADGRVVYAGSGLRGYGNLIIVKHNNTYLTAYAHNQALLVKEDQAVRKGQRIADLGSSDSDRVQLHFEIRRLGKPVDPARLLPPR